MDLNNYWRIFHRQRRIVLYIFLTVFVSAIFSAHQTRPVYLAKATVKIEQRQLPFLWKQGPSKFSFDIVSEEQSVGALRLMEETARRLASERDAGLSAFSPRLFGEDIEVEQVKGSNIVEISARASRPEEAAELANKAAEVYIELSVQEERRKVRLFQQMIERQLNISNLRLEESRQALDNFKEKEGDIAWEKQICKDRLAALELKFADYRRRYLPQSLQVQEAEEQVQAVKRQLNELTSKEFELYWLSRNFDYFQKRYTDCKEWVLNIQLSEEDMLPQTSIINPASRPKFPVSPNKLLDGLVGAVLGLVVGISYVFLKESAETSLKTIEEAEIFMKLPVLGAIPYLTTQKEKARLPWRWLRYTNRQDELSRLRGQLIVHCSPQSPMAESYRSLRTTIKNVAFKKGADQALLVTSSGPVEGKSITAANLAIAVAWAGDRVVLLDGDLRRPILDKLFGLEREPGLTDYLTGVAKWEEILQDSNLDNLKIIASGQFMPNPAEILHSAQLKPLVEELKAHFDFILFDSPPALPITDAAILGPLLDGVILVYQIGKASRQALARTREQLEGVGAEVKGVVLNNTTREMELYPPDRHYWYRYYRRKQNAEENS